ncbi:MAG: RNA polymerase sigma factor [Alphaproteobacteria bacterium]|nr:RNA polymerase sigma factor [Alphaproteobacteria bacterium]
MDPEQLLTHGYRYALSLTGDVPAAEDLLQDAWTSVLAAQGPMDRAYLFRTIRNRWIDGHRRGRLVVLDPDGGPEVPVRPEAERLIEADALWEGLLALREEEREALYLHHVEGWSAQEVGERTGRPRNTVLSLLRRGRQRLESWPGQNGLEVTG